MYDISEYDIRLVSAFGLDIGPAAGARVVQEYDNGVEVLMASTPDGREFAVVGAEPNDVGPGTTGEGDFIEEFCADHQGGSFTVMA